MKKETIAAIATAMTNSGIGIVRVSGPEAFSIIQKIYQGKKKKDFSSIPTHTIHYGYIVDGEETIDEVLEEGKYNKINEEYSFDEISKHIPSIY